MDKYNAEAILFSRNNIKYTNILSKIFEKYNVNFLYKGDFFDLASEIVYLLPEFILIDGSTFNVAKFPYHLLTHFIFKERTKIIILSENFICENKYIDVVDFNYIENYIENYFKNRQDIKEYSVPKDRSNIINDFLISIGFSSKLTGKDYLKDCINLLINHRLLSKGLNRNCYTLVANKNRTKTFNVERTIRTAIKNAYLNRKPNHWEQVFNTNFDRMPSVKTFIFMCVDKIIEIKNL